MNLMHDSAWDAVKHLDLKRVTEEGGTDVVLAAPDAFCGNAPDAARVEAIEDALYGTKAGKDITSFVSRVETKFHRFHDVANIVLHEVASGYILGGQLGITQERFREFMTFTSRSLEYDKIKSSRPFDASSGTSIARRSARPRQSSRQMQSNRSRQRARKRRNSPRALQVLTAENNDDEESLLESMDEEEAAMVLITYREAPKKKRDGLTARGWRAQSSSTSSSTRSSTAIADGKARHVC